MLNGFIIAFSMYSKIPMPHRQWKDEDMRYSMCFFPFVGIVIGAVAWLWFWLCGQVAIPETACVGIGLAIPILITGGFHIDGYMDTMDAIHSYGSKERKLEILKDSHIGAFAVIMLVLYVLLFVSGYSMISNTDTIKVYCMSFILSRILSALSLVSFRKAKSTGSLAQFAQTAGKGVRLVIIIELFAVVALMLVCDWLAGLTAIILAAFAFLYYAIFSRKNFDGITGDIAGYFLCVCELVMVMGLGILDMVRIYM